MPSSLVVHRIKFQQKDNFVYKVRIISPASYHAVCEDPEAREALEGKVGHEAENQIVCKFDEIKVLRSRKDIKDN